MYTTEFLDLPPLVRAGGRVRLPGSKSISNRVLLLAGLAAGTTEVHDLLDSDDTRVMLDALRQLGCGLVREGAVLKVTGLGGQLAHKDAQLFLGNAGTAMRPLTAALAVLAASQGGQFQLSGVARMHERPIGDLVLALRQLGCPVADLGQPGFPPLQVGDGAQHALNTAAPIRVRGDVSSQFLTALLLALPLVTAQGPVAIEVDGELISKPYIDITLRLLARFGIAFGDFLGLLFELRLLASALSDHRADLRPARLVDRRDRRVVLPAGRRSRERVAGPDLALGAWANLGAVGRSGIIASGQGRQHGNHGNTEKQADPTAHAYVPHRLHQFHPSGLLPFRVSSGGREEN